MHRRAKWIGSVQRFLSPVLVSDQLGSRSCECAYFLRHDRAARPQRFGRLFGMGVDRCLKMKP